jgi:Cu2+-containing amine oxidase
MDDVPITPAQLVFDTIVQLQKDRVERFATNHCHFNVVAADMIEHIKKGCTLRKAYAEACQKHGLNEYDGIGLRKLMGLK